MNAATVVRPVSRRSLGIHSGVACEATLVPAEFGAGITFRTVHGPVPARLAFASAPGGATVLRCGPAQVHTPEHLLAALCALGITDLTIDLVGPEVPALDGSAQGWVEAIDEAGRTYGPPVAVRRVETVAEVHAEGGWARIGPGRSIGVEVDFPDGPRGALTGALDEAFFRTQIAWARTFVLARDVPRLQAAGRGRGATPENTLVWPGGTVRAPDEPVRHKLLDAWGDLALLGPVEATFHVVRGGHALHQAILAHADATLLSARA